MANDVLSVSVPMNNARFGRLLSDEEMAELERRQRHYDARERATAAGLPPPTLDYDGNPMTVMKAWDERKAAERAAAMANLASGQGGQGDVDARLATPETSPLFTVGQMAGAPAALVSTATGLATMAKEVKDGRPENLIPAAISLYPGLKLNRLMFAGRSAPSTMEFLLYDKANPEAVPRVLEVPYKAGAIGGLSPARAGSLDKWASWFTRSPKKLVDLLKDGSEKTELVKYYPGIEDVDFLLGSGMSDRTLGMVRQNPNTGKPSIILSAKYLARGGIETVDGLVTEPLDVVAHEGGAHVPQELAEAYWGTTPRDVYNVTHRDMITAALRKAAGNATPVKMSPESAQNIINYHKIEQTIKARYPEEVRKAFFFEPDTTDKGIMYGMMQDDVAYNAYRRTAGELHAFEIGARSSDPSLRTGTIKELPEDAIRFRVSDLSTQQDAKGGDTRADAKGGDSPGPETAVSETPVSEPAPQDRGGPRIVINPTTFRNKKDALCVAFNEAFRVLMELNGFEPMSEPTERQRRFFSDTAYANDEIQLRRTILARIATFDTSVKDPTPEQVEETVEFLHTVLEIGAPQNEWEQSAVQRLIDGLESQAGSSTPTISSSRTTR